LQRLLSARKVSLAFSEIPASIARALNERNYSDATPVQKAVLDAQTSERDLLVSAQTGSGKTVAYGLALAETLLDGAETLGPAGEPLALIIAPTRELALQVQRELSWLYHYAGARVTACVGGMDPGAERRELSGGVHIVVGTPGRLRDHLERRALKVQDLKAVVLDEADEMLDMGFREDLQFILETTPDTRRTLLFSATLPKAIVTLARHYQRDALRVETRGETGGHADIEYRAVKISHGGMERTIVNLLRFIDPSSALIFCNTRQSVRHLEATLNERGFNAVSLSGELSQSERNHALQALRDGRARVCVATDVAARGIDLPNLSLVIHAELPSDAQVLQHRSGRTGRAGRKGVSILLVPGSRHRRAEELLARARVSFRWSEPPSADDIRKLDTDRLLQNPILSEPSDSNDADIVDALLAAHSPRAVAAAFVKLYRSRLPAPEEVSEPNAPEPRTRREPKKGPQNRDHQAERPHRPERHDTKSAHKERSQTGVVANGPWFLLNVGRERNADPKWLLPEICRQGEVTKQDIGAIRVYDRETRFQVDPSVAEKFTALVAARQKGGVRIFPAPGNSGEQSLPRTPHGNQEIKPTEQLPFADKKKQDRPFGQKAKHNKKFPGNRPKAK
jgi:ATP-dependent RNA helicase DeaD